MKALGLLALLVALHYGYAICDPEDRAQAWNMAGAVARAALLVALSWKWRGPVLLVVAWWLAEEAMVAGCSAAYIVKPWVVAAGQDQCSALLHFDLAKLGAAVILSLLAFTCVRRQSPD